MSVDSKKTILLEKKYLYVRASLGFQLEGTSTEIIPTNNGFYRFYIDNLSKALGNSYVNIIYDSSDLSFQSFCSDLYMDELMSSDSSAIEDVVEELKNNTLKIGEFENGVSSALQSNHEDNVATVEKLNEFESGVSAGLASNHADNVALSTLLKNYLDNNFFIGFDNSTSSFLSSRSGDLVKGVAPKYIYYFLDVDKFSLFNDSWRCSENINVRGAERLNTFIDSVFNFESAILLKCYKYFLSSTAPSRSLQCLYSSVGFWKIPSSTTGNYYSNNLGNDIILICTDFSLSDSVFSKLVFGSHSKKFSKFSYNNSSSLPHLYFYKVESCSTCCINQVVDVPFSSDTLLFSFDCNLDIDTLKSLTYHFVTDVMDVSFTGSALGMHYSTTAPYKIECGPSPMLHPDGTIAPSRLIKVYVTK